MDELSERTYTFSNIEELYQTSERLPKASRHSIYAHHEAEDEWEQINWRNSLWLPGYGAVGDVSSSTDYYNVIQYGEILESVGQAVEQYDGTIDLEGYVALSPSGHKMSSRVDFYGDTTIEPVDGDEITLGLKIRSGHSGFHAVKYDVGAERQVCSNGMIAFDSDLSLEQTHGEPFNPGLAYQAVDAVVEGADEVEDRLLRAREDRFQDYDEALLVLADFGIDQYFEEPVSALQQALDEETGDGGSPTLYDTYNAATRALTHFGGEEMPQYVRDQGLEQAARLLDYPGYGLPDAEYLGERAVTNRIDERVEAEEELPAIVGETAEEERDRLTELRATYTEGG